jgi:hypothetical protein
MGNIRLNGSLWVYAMPIVLALASLGCGLAGAVGGAGASAQATPTRTPMPTFTTTPAGVAFVQASATPIPPPPTNTPLPTPTEVVEVAPSEPSSPLPTPEPAEAANEGPVTITLIQNMNVRGGPGTNYPVVGPGPAGETAKVLGRNADSSWLQVEYPLTDDGTGWVYAALVQINGDPQTAEFVQAPPAPAAPPPQETKEEAPPPEPEVKYQFTPTGWHASENAAIVQFKGRIRDEGGNLVNGFSVLLNNDAFSVLSHPTGASRWYPDKGDGEWDVVMPNLFDAQGWWKLTVVTYDCPGFQESGFNAQCKQYTKLSEDVRIQVVTPEESIINADWVCHWDCDKGLYVNAFRR